jgi:pyruvate,water dikinase
MMAGGPPSVSAQQGYDLAELARLAMRDPVASAWLTRRATQPGDADWRRMPADNPWREAFARFLDRYGHRAVNETHVRQPRWHEAPDYLLDNLPALAAVDLPALAARQQALAGEALRTVRAALPWYKHPLLRLALQMAKRESNLREAARSAFIADVEPLRRLGLALGARWVQHGWLDAADQILLLMPVEWLAVLDGERPGSALRTLVAERAARFAAWQAAEAPDVIIRAPASGESARPPASPTPAGDTAQAASGDIWQGVAVGGGQAVGPVRLIRAPEDGHRLAPGDILVAPATDPAWTPLFLRAAGLVMETGGFMSHGAIVAREFGIPAVVNIAGVMAALREGEPVEIDGRAGTLRRMS